MESESLKKVKEEIKQINFNIRTWVTLFLIITLLDLAVLYNILAFLEKIA